MNDYLAGRWLPPVTSTGTGTMIDGIPYAADNGAPSGRIEVYSGASGSLLRSASGGSAGDQLGYSVTFLGDLNEDGFDDYAMGAPVDGTFGATEGTVRGFSGATGTVLYTFHVRGPARDTGSQVAS